MPKDAIRELSDAMIARFDTQEGVIIGQVRAVRDEQTAQIKAVRDELSAQCKAMRDDLTANLGAKIDEVRSELTGIGKKVEKNQNDIKEMDGRLRELEEGNSQFQYYLTKELNEIESKKPNILLFGIPENMALSGNPLRQEDAKVVDKLLQVVAEKKSRI